jgi:hypothetical protein
MVLERSGPLCEDLITQIACVSSMVNFVNDWHMLIDIPQGPLVKLTF